MFSIADRTIESAAQTKSRGRLIIDRYAGVGVLVVALGFTVAWCGFLAMWTFRAILWFVS